MTAVLLLALVFAIPALGALLGFAIPSNRARPWVLPVAGSLHLAAVLVLLSQPPGDRGGWFYLDAPGSHAWWQSGVRKIHSLWIEA